MSGKTWYTFSWICCRSWFLFFSYSIEINWFHFSIYPTYDYFIECVYIESLMIHGWESIHVYIFSVHCLYYVNCPESNNDSWSFLLVWIWWLMVYYHYYRYWYFHWTWLLLRELSWVKLMIHGVWFSICIFSPTYNVWCNVLALMSNYIACWYSISLN